MTTAAHGDLEIISWNEEFQTEKYHIENTPRDMESAIETEFLTEHRKQCFKDPGVGTWWERRVEPGGFNLASPKQN